MSWKAGRTLRGLGSVLLTVTAALVLAYREPPVGPDHVPEALPAPIALASTGAPVSEAVEPDELAGLFGLSLPTAPTAPPPPDGKPNLDPASSPDRRVSIGQARYTTAPLRYVGWACRGKERIFLFADRLTGRVFQLVQGCPSGGWTLEEEDTNQFVLSDGCVAFSVERR